MGLPRLRDAPVRRLQKLELRLPADERGAHAADAARPHERQGAHEAAGRDPALLSLRVDARRLAELEGAARGARGPLSDEDAAGLDVLLEAGGDVHGVAGLERAALTPGS